MIEIPLNANIEITESSLGLDLSVEVDYRCYVNESVAFAPMTGGYTIHHGNSLQECIQNGKESYEKDYERVEVIAVRIGEFEWTPEEEPVN